MTIYNVKNGGSDLASGQGDANAWVTLNKINISSFNPGDSILLKRGSTWHEQLVIPSVGNAGNKLTFGNYTGNGGALPIIDGDATGDNGRDNCILINGKVYIVIDGIVCQNARQYTAGQVPDHAGIVLQNSSNNVTVKNATVYCPYSQGITVSGSQNFTLESTLLDTTLNTSPGENNLIYFTGGGGSTGHVIGGSYGKGNTFYQRKVSGEYVDGIQTYLENGPFDVSYNYFRGENTNNSGNMLNLFEVGSGTLNIYNNVYYRGTGNSEGGAVIFDGSWDVYFEHNTVVNLVGSPLSILSDVSGQKANVYAHNNIFYATTAAWSPCWKSPAGSPPAGHPNYNLYYNTGGSSEDIGYVGSTSYTWAQWQAYREANGVYGDPLFTNLAGKIFTLESGSPARNIGTTPALTITDDFAGNPRVAPFDAGAYEYPSGPKIFVKW